MTLDFDKPELDSLMEAVDTKIVIIMNELAHTDSHDYRDFLKQRIAALERIQRKLGAYVAIPRHRSATVP
jgi:hypothetical protein